MEWGGKGSFIYSLLNVGNILLLRDELSAPIHWLVVELTGEMFAECQLLIYVLGTQR